MIPMTDSNFRAYRDKFTELLEEVLNEMEIYFNTQVDVMRDHDFTPFTRGDLDFEEFAAKSFFYKLRNIYDEKYEEEAAVQKTREIIEATNNRQNETGNDTMA